MTRQRVHLGVELLEGEDLVVEEEGGELAGEGNMQIQQEDQGYVNIQAFITCYFLYIMNCLS